MALACERIRDGTPLTTAQCLMAQQLDPLSRCTVPLAQAIAHLLCSAGHPLIPLQIRCIATKWYCSASCSLEGLSLWWGILVTILPIAVHWATKAYAMLMACSGTSQTPYQFETQIDTLVRLREG